MSAQQLLSFGLPVSGPSCRIRNRRAPAAGNHCGDLERARRADRRCQRAEHRCFGATSRASGASPSARPSRGNLHRAGRPMPPAPRGRRLRAGRPRPGDPHSARLHRLVPEVIGRLTKTLRHPGAKRSGLRPIFQQIPAGVQFPQFQKSCRPGCNRWDSWSFSGRLPCWPWHRSG